MTPDEARINIAFATLFIFSPNMNANPGYRAILRAMLAGEWKCESCKGTLDIEDFCDIRRTYLYCPCDEWQPRKGGEAR